MNEIIIGKKYITLRGIKMKMNRRKIAILVVLSLSLSLLSGCVEKFKEVEGFDMKTIENIKSERIEDAVPIIVSNKNPFYAVIATPVALYYDEEEHVEPLLVEDFDNPSKTVIRFKEYYPASYIEIRDGTPENVSISLSNIWEKSDAALIIEDSQKGYELGIVAAPLASYLNIPIFVTNSTDNIKSYLKKLGVKYTFMCGELEGYGITWRFDSVDEINDLMIEFLNKKFGGIKYITMANPLDAWPPRVLNRTVFHFEGKTSSVAILPSTITSTAKGFMNPGKHNFTIPEGYKYALVKIDLENLDSEDVEDLGDYLTLSGGPRLEEVPLEQQMFEIQITTMAGIPERDENGRIIKDKLHYEMVLYDRDGVTYDLQVIGTWLAKKEGSYRLNVTVESLENPYYPLMKNLSSIAPYLTAYRKGLLFAKPEFAFAENDNVTVNGEKCPGFYVPRKNPKLAIASNEHVLKIHEMLNNLLAKIANISSDDLEKLRNYYAENPIYIAIVGGATMIPQYIYENPDTPLDEPMAIYYFGYGTPSDFIYGDIDPNPNDIKNDTFTKWPFQENIVARVTGWDVQDASALICRTIFYEEIVKKLTEWRKTATVQTGCGTDFQKIPILEQIKNILAPFLGGAAGEPMKFPSVATHFSGDYVASVIKEGGYEVLRTEYTVSQYKGFSDEGLNKIKKAGVLNMLLFPKTEIKLVSGEKVVKGGEYQERSNIIYANGHGSMHLYEFGDVFMWGRGIGYVIIPIFMEFLTRISIFATPLGALGTYCPRNVENMELGPSVVIIESCVVGKIDGMYPQNNIGQAYLHAGANALVAASTFTNVAGYLKPRPFVNSFGIIGYLKAWYDLITRGEYPEVNFGVIIHTDFTRNLIENNTDIGTAFRNARNSYLPKDANSTFLWVPPLEKQLIKRGTKVMNKKYNTFLEYNLFGDPAFNPYQPVNNG